MLEVIAAFEQATGQKVPYKIVDRRPGDVSSAYADPSKAARTGLESRTRHLRHLPGLVNWQQKNRQGLRVGLGVGIRE
ncbi:MAG: hypothetical protein R2911_03905 [Caldilineaceae bacterium]